jgi:hypothetical protein
MRTTVSWIGLGLALGALTGCGSDLTCGPGTTEKGEQCVAAAAGSAGSAGSGGNPTGDGGVVDAPPSVDGVTSLAPASDASLQVTWDPALDDGTEPEHIVYRVYVATSEGDQNFARPTAVSPPGATALVVANLRPNTEHFVIVRAVDAAGNEDDNSVELAGTPEKDTTPPTFAGAKRAKAFASNAVEVLWDPASDDKTPAEGISYTVRWSAQPGAAAILGSVGALTPPGATSAVVRGLPEPVSSYHFYVQARDAAGNADDNEVTISGKTGSDVTPPIFAGCSSVAEPGATRATAAWEPASDDTTKPEQMTYNVYAFSEPVDDQTPFGAPVGTFVGGALGVVDGLRPKTTYYLVCRAADKTGNEEQNIAFRQVTTKEDGSAPVFAGIVAAVPDATTAELSWTAATDDQTPSEEIVYLIYQSRSPNPVTSGMLLEPGPVPGATNFTVTGLTSRTQYYWAVRASDRAGNVDENAAIATEITLVSFANDVQPIFSTSCAKTTCHMGENAPQGMRLEEGYAYSNIVNIQTVWPTEDNPHFGARIDRIEPGDPFRSFLWHKLNFTSEVSGTDTSYDPPRTWSFGLGMPRDTFPTKLPQSSLDIIESWILDGARNN